VEGVYHNRHWSVGNPPIRVRGNEGVRPLRRLACRNGAVL
jgi:hypothetical protein